MCGNWNQARWKEATQLPRSEFRTNYELVGEFVNPAGETALMVKGTYPGVNPAITNVYSQDGRTSQSFHYDVETWDDETEFFKERTLAEQLILANAAMAERGFIPLQSELPGITEEALIVA